MPTAILDSEAWAAAISRCGIHSVTASVETDGDQPDVVITPATAPDSIPHDWVLVERPTLDPNPDDNDWVLVGESTWMRFMMWLALRSQAAGMIVAGLIGFFMWTKFGFASVFLAMSVFGVVSLVLGSEIPRPTNQQMAMLSWLGVVCAFGKRMTPHTMFATFLAIQTYFIMPSRADVSSWYHGLRRRIRS